MDVFSDISATPPFEDFMEKPLKVVWINGTKVPGRVRYHCVPSLEGYGGGDDIDAGGLPKLIESAQKNGYDINFMEGDHGIDDKTTSVLESQNIVLKPYACKLSA